MEDKLQYFIEDVNRLEEVELGSLEEMVKRYPFHNNWRVLHAIKLVQLNKTDELTPFHRAAMYSIDRYKLQQMLSGVNNEDYIVHLNEKKPVVKKKTTTKKGPKKKRITKSITEIETEKHIAEGLFTEGDDGTTLPISSIGKVSAIAKTKKVKAKKVKVATAKAKDKTRIVEDVSPIDSKAIEVSSTEAKSIVAESNNLKLNEKDEGAVIEKSKLAKTEEDNKSDTNKKKKKKKAKKASKLKAKRVEQKEKSKKKKKKVKKGKINVFYIDDEESRMELDKSLGNKSKRSESKANGRDDKDLAFMEWLSSLAPVPTGKSDKTKKKTKKKTSSKSKNIKGEGKKNKSEKKLNSEKKKLRKAKKNNEIISEALAMILVNQGHITKAIKMYDKLSLKYPEKSSYFAAQIDKMKGTEND